MFKVGDIIAVEERNIGVIVSVDEHYVNIYWSDDRILCYDYSHLAKLVTRQDNIGDIWSHHAN